MTENVRRPWLNVLTGFCVLLGAAIAGLLGWAYTSPHTLWRWQNAAGTRQARLGVSYEMLEWETRDLPSPPVPLRPGQADGFVPVRRYHGFGLTHVDQGMTRLSRQGLTLPGNFGTQHWTALYLGWPMAAAIAFPIWRLIAWWRLRRVVRHNPGRCLTCSYDLTGNMSGVCPECGTPLAPQGEA